MAIQEVTSTKYYLQREYINSTLESNKGDPSAIWKCMKHFWPTKNEDEPSRIKGLTDPKEIANVLNSFFANVGADLANDFVSDENDYYWP